MLESKLIRVSKRDHWCRIYTSLITIVISLVTHICILNCKQLNQCWIVFIYSSFISGLLNFHSWICGYVLEVLFCTSYNIMAYVVWSLTVCCLIKFRLLRDTQAVASASSVKWQIIQACHLSYRLSWLQITSIILAIMGWIPNCVWYMDIILRTNRVWCSKIAAHENICVYIL